MIYELLYLVKTEAPEQTLTTLKSEIKSAVEASKGNIVLEDDWGRKRLAQPTNKGIDRAQFQYVMFEAAENANLEIERRLKINESVLKYLTVKLGETAEKDKLLKEYQEQQQANNNVDEKNGMSAEKEKKIFSKRKTCWFSAKKTKPDWKRPETYSWLVNDFGKISPARVTGLRPRFQRMSNTAIKRGRCVGLISHLSNEVARDL
jgi:ribosomal protein S6/ribosomal protein S18